KAGAANAALLAAQVLAISDFVVFNRLAAWRATQTNDVLNNPDPREA
ncbi:5-(carboxyamino)imidazole ribonucleotide mutase, partial [Vibrio parahaemolyticus]